jgi:hypothetical protein
MSLFFSVSTQARSSVGDSAADPSSNATIIPEHDADSASHRVMMPGFSGGHAL